MKDIVLKHDDLFDRIEKYYHNSGKLTQKEESICERWELAFALLCSTKNKKLAVTKFLAAMKAKGEVISTAQAYRDFTAAEKLFTPIRKYSKEFLRLVLIESAFKDIREADKRAKSAKDARSWSEIMRVKHQAEKRIIDASGLQFDDPNLPDFSKIQPTQFKLNVDERVMEMMQKMLGRGVVDVTQMFTSISDAEVIESEEDSSDVSNK